MSRSTWKGPFSEVSTGKAGVKVWSRRSMILPGHLGKLHLVHNGKQYITLKITELMAGHKFGEFAQTRKKPLHKRKKR